MRRARRLVLIVAAGCSLSVVATPARAQTGSVESRLKQLEDKEQIARC